MGGFSVLNNVSSLIAQQQAGIANRGLSTTLNRLSSGLRIVSGGDDAAGLAIADGLRGQIRTLQQSVRNANDGIGFAQTADSALGQVSNLLTRAASLLDQAASDTNNGQLSAINTELQNIFREIERVGAATSFNGTTVFAAGVTRNIFVGDTQNIAASTAQISFTPGELTASALGVNDGTIVSGTGPSLNVTLASGGDATSVLTNVEAAIDTVASRRGQLGAAINRLDSAVNVINSQLQNLTSAESQIRDADLATEVANLTKFQILSQVGISSLAQANAAQQSVLALFR